MTGAEFVAACFWPLVIAFGLLLKFVRKQDLLRPIWLWAAAAGALYLFLAIAYGESSLIAVIDIYLSMAALGGGLIWFALSAPAPDPKSKWQAFGMILVGAVCFGGAGHYFNSGLHRAAHRPRGARSEYKN
jgi:hypothetical protein